MAAECAARARSGDHGAPPRALTAPILRRRAPPSNASRCRVERPLAAARHAAWSPRNPGPRRARRRRPGGAAVPAHARARRAGRDRDQGARARRRIRRRLGRRSAPSARSIDHRRRNQWLVGGATGPLAVGVNYAVKLAIGRERPLIEDHPPLAKAPRQALLPLRARDLVGRRGDRARPSRATRASVPVRARGGDLRRAALSRHALPLRRPRRRRARLRARDGCPRTRHRTDRGATVRARGRRQPARAGDQPRPRQRRARRPRRPRRRRPTPATAQ